MYLSMSLKLSVLVRLVHHMAGKHITHVGIQFFVAQRQPSGELTGLRVNP